MPDLKQQTFDYVRFYEMGVCARLEDLELSDSPYAPGSQEHEAWAHGWAAADEECR